MRAALLKMILAGTSFAAMLPAAAQQPAPPVLDAKALKETEALLSQRYSREPSDLLRHLERVGPVDPGNLSITDRFLLRFVTGDWSLVRQELLRMPPDLARRIFDKVLADLAGNRRPNVRLEDVLGLADAVPGELTAGDLRRLGQLLSAAVPLSETYWLEDRLRKGTAHLGGEDPAKRLNAARVLLAGNFKDLARSFLPPAADIELLPDEELKNELRDFLATQEEREKSQRDQAMRVWDENIAILLTPSASRSRASETSRATSALVKILTQVPSSVVAAALTESTRTNPGGALSLLSAFLRKVQAERGGDPALRAENLAALASFATLLTGLVPAGEQPWKEIFELMADHWNSEAEIACQQLSQKSQRFVPPEELLATAPQGKWLAILPASVRDRIDVSIARLILSGARFDQAAERIVEIGKRSPSAGAALAGDFLAVWGKMHNPQLPEEMRKRYGLPEDARIPVTPVMMEKNIDSLASMMSLFRAAGIPPKDESRLVTAFDLAYSTAETYRTSHLEKVFGPLPNLDESVFLLILSRMNANLGERWRKMEVQRGNLTRRDEAQTLDMVRQGYGAVLHLIEAWSAHHPHGWRALTLAGTALADWADFEYFQQLTTDAPGERMSGFQEKNLQAQEYFERAATAYAGVAPRLPRTEYSVEAHLAWFHALLGIGSNNQLNLSKPLNRAALGKIREHLASLPGQAAQQHLSLFARIVNARLNDEKEPLHEDLRYRYLAGALLITKDDPFTFGASKKLTYYDELLREVRLQTRVDGPNTVGRDQDFGIIFSILHTEAMGRAARFGQYLSNETNAGGSRSRGPAAHKMSAAQGARDELEMNLTQALSPFFDIQSITFATPDVKPRPTAQPGWEETVLAYLQVRAKDASVDKIPPVEMPLRFIDMSGPVSIPAESAETVIRVAPEGAPPRPASHIEIAQTLDTRQFPINGSLTLEIKATATGLVPELEHLLTFDPKAAIGVKNIHAQGGLQIRELNTWGDEVTPTSQRLWTITLDGDALRAAARPVEFRFPAPVRRETSLAWHSYQDMNLTELDRPSLTLGGQPDTPLPEPPPRSAAVYLWLISALALLAIAAYWFLFPARRNRDEDPRQTPETFSMPADLDAFSAVLLLRRMAASPHLKLNEAQRQELQSDLRHIEQSGFGNHQDLSEAGLRAIAGKWLQSVSR